MSNHENGSQAQTRSNTEIVKQESEGARADAETLKLKLEAEEISRRLNRKWYDIRAVAPKLISGLVGIALAAAYFVGVIEPIRQRERQVQRLDVRALSLTNTIQEHENTIWRQKNEQATEALQAENRDLEATAAEAESRATELGSLLEKLAGDYNLLAAKPGLSEREQWQYAELARMASEQVAVLQQKIRRLGAARKAAQTRTEKIREHSLTDWRTVLVTVLDPGGMPISGIYLDRIPAGAKWAQPIEGSTDSRGQRHIQAHDGDRICTQDTEQFVSAYRTIDPDTTEITLILERR